MSIRVIFLGSPKFALPSLRSLAESYKVVGVVTQPDRPAGRGREMKSPPVKILANELDIPVIQPENIHITSSIDELSEWEADVIIVAAFGQILRKKILELKRHGCLNVHASLLPRWRGAAPINAAIYHDDDNTGITIMKMDEGLDTGPILSQEAIPILETDEAGILSKKLAELGGELLIKTLPRYISGEITPTPQNDSKATYAPMLKKEDGNLDFTQTAEQLARKVRAYSPWPGTFMSWQEKFLKVHKTHTIDSKIRKPGQTVIQGKLPGVVTADGILILDEVQPAGKKRMTGQTFLNGARNWGKLTS
ncbi:MAG: methionyl-tRNA formyltransferase [Anaerolineales bacterium]